MPDILTNWTGDLDGVTIGKAYTVQPGPDGSAFLDDDEVERDACWGSWTPTAFKAGDRVTAREDEADITNGCTYLLTNADADSVFFNDDDNCPRQRPAYRYSLHSLPESPVMLETVSEPTDDEIADQFIARHAETMEAVVATPGASFDPETLMLTLPTPAQAKPGPKTVTGEILEEALGIVEGARNVTHGDKERSFVAIAKLWNAYLDMRPRRHGEILASDVGQMMVLLKMARSKHGTPHRDHFVDAAGYAALAGELALSEAAQ